MAREGERRSSIFGSLGVSLMHACGFFSKLQVSRMARLGGLSWLTHHHCEQMDGKATFVMQLHTRLDNAPHEDQLRHDERR